MDTAVYALQIEFYQSSQSSFTAIRVSCCLCRRRTRQDNLDGPNGPDNLEGPDGPDGLEDLDEPDGLQVMDGVDEMDGSEELDGLEELGEPDRQD